MDKIDIRFGRLVLWFEFNNYLFFNINSILQFIRRGFEIPKSAANIRVVISMRSPQPSLISAQFGITQGAAGGDGCL